MSGVRASGSEPSRENSSRVRGVLSYGADRLFSRSAGAYRSQILCCEMPLKSNRFPTCPSALLLADSTRPALAECSAPCEQVMNIMNRRGI